MYLNFGHCFLGAESLLLLQSLVGACKTVESRVTLSRVPIFYRSLVSGIRLWQLQYDRETTIRYWYVRYRTSLRAAP